MSFIIINIFHIITFLISVQGNFAQCLIISVQIIKVSLELFILQIIIRFFTCFTQFPEEHFLQYQNQGTYSFCINILTMFMQNYQILFKTNSNIISSVWELSQYCALKTIYYSKIVVCHMYARQLCENKERQDRIEINFRC